MRYLRVYIYIRGFFCVMFQLFRYISINYCNAILMYWFQFMHLQARNLPHFIPAAEPSICRAESSFTKVQITPHAKTTKVRCFWCGSFLKEDHWSPAGQKSISTPEYQSSSAVNKDKLFIFGWFLSCLRQWLTSCHCSCHSSSESRRSVWVQSSGQLSRVV